MIETDVDLQSLNTLAVSARANFFTRVTSLEELREALEFARKKKLPLLPLGGGSNIVLTGDFPGLAIHIALKGFSVERQSQGATVTAAAGENWHQLVMQTVQENLGGLESLALIPGNIGAAPIQNIGAYGVELKDTFKSLSAMHIASGKMQEFSRQDCEFGYRDSIFKQCARDQFIVCKVRLQLPENWRAKVEYPALQQYFAEHKIDTASLRPDQVAEAVISIRNSKLPNPQQIPNAGSFFKNPVVDAELYQSLQSSHPDLVAFAAGDQWKLAAGWLIDRAGWKGVRRDGVGVHDKQALVLVNPGHSPGSAVTCLAEEISADILAKFGVLLEPEPRFYP